MKYTGEDTEYKYFVDIFGDIEIRMQVCKSTNQLYFNQDDVAKALGFKDDQEMITSSPELTDKYLDAMNNGMVIKTRCTNL